MARPRFRPGASLIQRGSSLSLSDRSRLRKNAAVGRMRRPRRLVSENLEDRSLLATVVQSGIVYNDSFFDGYDNTLTLIDNEAIAPGKPSALPGQVASPANVSSYVKGINGVFLDIEGLPGTPSIDDFQFRTGKFLPLVDWPLSPKPRDFQVFPGVGEDGSDRVVISWNNQDIIDEWLQVIVRANPVTGLADPFVFHIGNQIGDVGNSIDSPATNGADFAAVRANSTSFLNPADLEDPHDFNRDGRVDAIDLLIVRDWSTGVDDSISFHAFPSGIPPVIARLPDLQLGLDAGPIEVGLHIDDADGDPLAVNARVRSQAFQSPATMSISQDETVLTVSPTEGFVGRFEVVVEVSDGTYLMEEAFYVDVNPKIQLPRNVGTLELPLSLDEPNGEVTFEVSVVSYDGDTEPVVGAYGEGILELTIDPVFHGQFVVDVVGKSGTDEATTRLTFEVVNTAPMLTPIANQVMNQDDNSRQVDLLAVDTDGDPVAYSATILTDPASASLLVEANLLTITPDTGFTGDFVIEVTVDDGLETDVEQFTVTVEPSNVYDGEPVLDLPNNPSGELPNPVGGFNLAGNVQQLFAADEWFSPKYAAYRDRYLDRFLFNGMSAELIKQDGSEIRFGDQTVDMGFAMLVFAAESDYLRRQGYDTSESEEIIRTLLDAFEQLDHFGEQVAYGTEVPGFFVRDSVIPSGNHANIDELCSRNGSCLDQYGHVHSDLRPDAPHHDAAMSLDQTVHLLMGWWAITRWSSDPESVALAQDQTRRVMAYLDAHGFNIDTPDGRSIPGGRGPDFRILSGFLSRMAEEITGDSYLADPGNTVQLEVHWRDVLGALTLGASEVVNWVHERLFGSGILNGLGYFPVDIPVAFVHQFALGIVDLAGDGLAAIPDQLFSNGHIVINSFLPDWIEAAPIAYPEFIEREWWTEVFGRRISMTGVEMRIVTTTIGELLEPITIGLGSTHGQHLSLLAMSFDGSQSVDDHFVRFAELANNPWPVLLRSEVLGTPVPVAISDWISELADAAPPDGNAGDGNEEWSNRNRWVRAGDPPKHHGYVYNGLDYLALEALQRSNGINFSGWDNSDAMAVIGNEVFVVQNGYLHSFDPLSGNYVVISDDVWLDTIAMDTIDDRLYAIQNERLYEINPYSDVPWSSFQRYGNSGWLDDSHMAMIGDTPYVVENDTLFRVNSDGSYTALTDAWEGTTSIAAMGGHLYIVQADRLHRVDPSDGSWTILDDTEWSGPTLSTALGDDLYIIQAGHLHRVDPANGDWEILGDEDWANNPTSMTAFGSSLFVIEGGALFEVDPISGDFSRRGDADWSGPTQMVSLAGELYVIQNGHLHVVNPNTGDFHLLSDADWIGTIAAAAGNDRIFAIQDERLWTINPAITRRWASYSQFGDASWIDVTAMVAREDFLYVIENGYLRRVDSDGSWQTLGDDDWYGPTAMVARDDSIFVVQNGHLHRVDPADGSWTVISDDAWVGTTSMTTIGDEVFVAQDSQVWRIDVDRTRPWSRFSRIGGATWEGETTMTSIGDTLFVIQNGVLHRINSDGSNTQLGGSVWEDDALLTSIGNELFVVESGHLHAVDPDTGVYTVISESDWANTKTITSYDNHIYAIDSEELWRIDPSATSPWSSFTGLGGSAWGGPLSMTTLGSYVYIIQGGAMWRVNPSNGAYDRLGSANWQDQTSMTAHDGSLYVIENDRLLRVNPSTGSWSFVGNSSWLPGAMITSLGSYLYVIEESRLFQVNPSSGSYTQLGSANWSGTTSLTSHGGYLYAIQNNHLHRIRANGSFDLLGGPDWLGATHLTGEGDWLYVVQAGTLHRVNPGTGDWVQISDVGDWIGTTGLVSHSDRLYAAQDNRLWRITPHERRWSDFSRVGSASWVGETRMTVFDDRLYVVEGEGLFRVNPSSGSFTQLGDDWAGTDEIAAYGQWLYIVQNETLHRVDPTDGEWRQISNVGAWPNATSLAATSAGLFAIDSDRLYEIDPQLTQPWSSYTSLDLQGIGENILIVGVGNQLLVSSGDRMWLVNPSGARVESLDEFNIDVSFPDGTLTASQQQIIRNAVQRWEDVIVRGLGDIVDDELGYIDDLLIRVVAEDICDSDDVPGSCDDRRSGDTIAQAGARQVRAGSLLPYLGEMTFDTDDIAAIEADGRLADTTMHEMGHILGLTGYRWGSFGLIRDSVVQGGSDPRYSGTNAVDAYNRLFILSEDYIPVEAGGGPGTQDSHWRESVFADELMTGYLAPIGTSMPLSEITIGALDDLGYEVDYDQADAYP